MSLDRAIQTPARLVSLLSFEPKKRVESQVEFKRVHVWWSDALRFTKTAAAEGSPSYSTWYYFALAASEQSVDSRQDCSLAPLVAIASHPSSLAMPRCTRSDANGICSVLREHVNVSW